MEQALDQSLEAMYCALVCGISSTMIVVKLLSEKGETDRPNGRLTVGILIFQALAMKASPHCAALQDIWAMVFLAIQQLGRSERASARLRPNLAKPDLLTLVKQFGMIFALVVLALCYAKFVMPAVLFFASKSVELMCLAARHPLRTQLQAGLVALMVLLHGRHLASD